MKSTTRSTAPVPSQMMRQITQYAEKTIDEVHLLQFIRINISTNGG